MQNLTKCVQFINSQEDFVALQRSLVSNTGVSDHAAAIRLIHSLPPHIIYTAEQDGVVLHAGSTARTNAFLQPEGSDFSKDFYPYTDKYSTYRTGSVVYHWWKLSTKINIVAEDTTAWREILNEMVEDIQPSEGSVQFKKTINSIMAFANGKTKREDDYSIDSLISACIYRLRRSELDDFVSHHDFEKFVKIKAQDLFKP